MKHILKEIACATTVFVGLSVVVLGLHSCAQNDDESARQALAEDCIEYARASPTTRLLDGPEMRDRCHDYFATRTPDQATTDTKRFSDLIEEARRMWREKQ